MVVPMNGSLGAIKCSPSIGQALMSPLKRAAHFGQSFCDIP
jgi:hypothetical protein